MSMYRYNGVPAPELPAALDGYPNMYICDPIITDGVVAAAVVVALPAKATARVYNGATEVVCENSESRCWWVLAEDGESWTFVNEGDGSELGYDLSRLHGETEYLIWANHDVLYEDGTVFLAYSDPVEETVTITGLTLNIEAVSLARGESVDITATLHITGTGTYNKASNLELAGNAAGGGTNVTFGGDESEVATITIGMKETSSKIVVTVTSVQDPSISDSATITVKDPYVYAQVTGLDLAPEAAELKRGESCRFTGTVSGIEGTDGLDKSVTYAIRGAYARGGTEITADGTLTIGAKEVSDKIVVRCASVADTSYWLDAAVTVTDPAPSPEKLKRSFLAGFLTALAGFGTLPARRKGQGG